MSKMKQHLVDTMELRALDLMMQYYSPLPDNAYEEIYWSEGPEMCPAGSPNGEHYWVWGGTPHGMEFCKYCDKDRELVDGNK
jgi:hypothetical protein